MIRSIIMLILASFCTVTQAHNERYYVQLDRALAHRRYYNNEKEKLIVQLKRKAKIITDTTDMLQLCDYIFEEYHYYHFDSAMVYVRKGLALAQKANKPYFYKLFLIKKANLLAAGGLYSESLGLLSSIDEKTLPHGLDYLYNLAYYWLYTYWSDYSNDSEYHEIYWKKKEYYLCQTILRAKNRPNDYAYLMGEYYMYVKIDHRKAISYYQKVLKNEPHDTRLYSTACFATAWCYRMLHQNEKYEEYMVRTAITDIITPVKENLSLYSVAEWIFLTNGDIRRAEAYVNASIDDAKFYNNRLRIIGSSAKLPDIVDRFKSKLNQKNTMLAWVLAGCLVLIILLFTAVAFIIRQNGMLTKRRKEISKSNRQLVELNGQLSTLNGKLQQQNNGLVDTNQKRERLAKLYIDLCSKYIDRLSSYQKLVIRKIKVGQVKDLLSSMTSSRLSDEDAASFLHGFDQAFLDQYPSFVEQFNDLLVPGNEVHPKEGSLTTELRIFALIRLGVKDSSEIANLLFYTPRTIYNYRSAIKSKARNRDTFENDVRNLCK